MVDKLVETENKAQYHAYKMCYTVKEHTSVCKVMHP